MTTEFAAGMYVFTDNDELFQGKTLEQELIYNLQGHLIYSFGSGIWGAFDTNYYTGGRTTRNNRLADDLQQNWRVGGTLAFPVSRHNSVKIYGSTGVYSRSGSHFNSVGIAWQYPCWVERL